MRNKINGTALFVGGINSAPVLTGGGAVAFAASGGTLVLGRANTATKTTTMSSAKTPLRLNSSSGFVRATGVRADITGDGVMDTTLATARCPAGTMLTGGGKDDFTGSPVLSDAIPIFDSPSADGKGWVITDILIDTFPGQFTGPDLTAYAICFNPSGPVGIGGRAFLNHTSSGSSQLTPTQQKAITAVIAAL